MEFLSDDWLGAADQAVRDSAATAPAIPLTIDQHIEGVVSYRVVIDRGVASVQRIDATNTSLGAPDAAFTQSAETARSLASGETDAHQAFLLGEITFAGDIDVVIARRDALDWLQAALAPVMELTDFGPLTG